MERTHHLPKTGKNALLLRCFLMEIEKTTVGNYSASFNLWALTTPKVRSVFADTPSLLRASEPNS
jgi:hypothetical protein